MELPVDPDGDNFQVGDLVETLIWTDLFICLAIIQTISIWKDQSTHHIIKTKALYNAKEGYTVQGEVLQVIQTSPSMWAWPPHDFMKVSKPKKSKPKKSAVWDFAVSILGVLCHQINPNISPIPDQLHSSGSLVSQTGIFHVLFTLFFLTFTTLIFQRSYLAKSPRLFWTISTAHYVHRQPKARVFSPIM